ncbi:MAG: hypothetical protein PHQ40_20025 [Anaerolineaceae bacterium]|nr:hypothetical protein [Anaerolineaceae bacterium]MDD5371375.1 hypothetical protein [Anaerolineaceae bacterium]
MNDRQLEKKVRQDAIKVKKDISTLVGDSAVRFGRFEDNLNQATGKAKEDLTTWVEDSSSQISEGLEKLTDQARETMVSAAVTVKKDVGHGLSQYNTRAQEVADKVPGGWGMKAARYPWVTISIALLVGFLLGIVINPLRHPLG